MKARFSLFLFTGVSVWICSITAGALEEYPQTTIGNDLLQVEIYLPDAEKGYYRGTRFEWSGLVQRVTHKGHRFFGDWKKTPHDPTHHDDVNGLAGEFSMGLTGVEPPLGYPEAKKGDPFLKMGVGILEKGDEEQYTPFIQHNIIQAFGWEIQQGTDWITFDQDIEPFQGWDYRYQKKISLKDDAPVLVVAHRLVNTGTREIASSHYCHNFIQIDEEPIGPDYIIWFPFQVVAKRSFGDYAEIDNQDLVIQKELVDQQLFSELGSLSRETPKMKFAIANRLTDAGIKMTSDYKPMIYNFYAARYAVCPEPYIDIKLKPGEEMTWEHRYTFYAERELPQDDPMEWPLDIRIDEDVVTPVMPLRKFLELLYFETYVKFSIDPDVFQNVKASVHGTPTVGEVLQNAFQDTGLLYKKLHNGVVRIYTEDSKPYSP